MNDGPKARQTCHGAATPHSASSTFRSQVPVLLIGLGLTFFNEALLRKPTKDVRVYSAAVKTSTLPPQPDLDTDTDTDAGAGAGAMDAVRQVLRRAGDGQLVEAAMRASRCQDLTVFNLLKKQPGPLPKRAGGGLAEARAGDGMAEATARRCESSPHTLPTPSTGAISRTRPLPSSSSSNITSPSRATPPLTPSSSSSVGSSGAISSLSCKLPSRSTSRLISTSAATRFQACSCVGVFSKHLPSRRHTTSSTLKLPPLSQLRFQACSCVGVFSKHLPSSRYSTSSTLKLPPLSQLSYDEDGRPEVWVEMFKFLKVYHDPFPAAPPTGSYTDRLSTDMFRKIRREVVKLVEINKKRGYDIAEDLRVGNVFFELHTGRVKLITVRGNAFTGAEFKGYIAAGRLFHGLLWALYHGTRSLSQDNAHFHMLLNQSSGESLDELRIIYNAALLSRFGRACLSLKILMLMSNDLPKLVINAGFYESLPHTTKHLDVFPTDCMHVNFKNLREASGEFKDQDRTVERQYLINAQEDLGQSWKFLTGKWLVRMNRNGTVHPPYGLLQYEAVDQLHSHTPLYLPESQRWFSQNKCRKYLEMENYFPEK